MGKFGPKVRVKVQFMQEGSPRERIIDVSANEADYRIVQDAENIVSSWRSVTDVEVVGILCPEGGDWRKPRPDEFHCEGIH